MVSAPEPAVQSVDPDWLSLLALMIASRSVQAPSFAGTPSTALSTLISAEIAVPQKKAADTRAMMENTTGRKVSGEQVCIVFLLFSALSELLRKELFVK